MAYRGYKNRQITDQEYLQKQYDSKKTIIGKPVFNPARTEHLKKCEECGGKLSYNRLGGKFCKCGTWYA